MGEIEPVERLAVKLDGLDVTLGVAHSGSLYFKRLSVRQFQFGIGKIRRSYHILVGTGADGIESEHAEDIPGAHLPAVVVAAQAADFRLIEAVYNLPQPVLGLPGLGGPGIKIGDVVAGLVAVHIAAQQALRSDIFVVGVAILWKVAAEEVVQVGDELLVAAHQLLQAVDILRHVEGIVQAVALDKSLTHSLFDVEFRLETAVGIAWTGEAQGRVEYVLVVGGAGEIALSHIGGAEALGSRCDAPVVVGILQGVARGGAGFVQRHISKFHILPEAAVPRHGGRGNHRLQRFFRIDIQALGYGVREHADRMVARHAPVLVGHVAPYRQHVVRALLVVRQHRGYHILRLPGLEQRQEGVLCAVGVPEREDGVVGEALRLVEFVVEPAIEPVHILIDGRIDHGVVEGGVEHGFLRLRALDFYAGQFLFPGRFRFCTYLREALSLRLRLKVLEGAGGAGGGYAYLHRQFGIGAGVELEPGGEFAPRHLREIVILRELAVSALVVDGGLVFPTVFGDWLGETDGEVGVVRARPAVGDAVAGDEGGGDHAYLSPEGLAVVVVDAVVEVQHNVAVRLGEGVAVHANALGSSEFRLDAAVRQGDFVVARAGGFGAVAEALAVSSVRILRSAGDQLHIALAGHYEDVSEVGVAGAAEVGVAEAYYGAVVVLVAGAVFIGARLVFPLDVVGDHVGVRAELHAPEGNAGPGEGVPHAGGADERIYILRVLC